MGCSVNLFFLDLFSFHKRINRDLNLPEQNADLLRRFVELLSEGNFITKRLVSDYASELCISPKYLSEVCKKVSGKPAAFWIDRFTINEITRLLKNKNLTLTQISDYLNFSSVAYFTRYVNRILGVTSSDYRKNK